MAGKGSATPVTNKLEPRCVLSRNLLNAASTALRSLLSTLIQKSASFDHHLLCVSMVENVSSASAAP